MPQKMNIIIHKLCVIVIGILATKGFAQSPPPATTTVPLIWKTAEGVDYLNLVRSYADLLIEKGRDTYGSVHSPLFAAALNRETFTIGKFSAVAGIRSSDRILTGANPMTDEYLYQILYALSAITKDPHYGEEADKALKFFLETTQSPQTGLFCWGKHLGWDFNLEAPAGAELDTHEFTRPWVLWQRCYSLAPDRCLKFAHGLWNHQIFDKKTGNFSRHAKWSRHEPRYNADFPRHGGYYIATWAYAYSQNKDAVFLDAIGTMVKHYGDKKSPQTADISAFPIKVHGFLELWPHSNLSLAVDLAGSADLLVDTDNDLVERMRALTADIDRVFLALPHGGGAAGEFFVTNADADTLEPKSNKERDAYAALWAASYGRYLSSNIANICYARYRQLPEGETKAAYKKLILECATRYLEAQPDMSKPLYPAALGDVIWLLIDVYNETKDPAYLKRAEHFAQVAVDKFFPKDIPLPVASSANTHYEAITRGDTLMASLLRLWNAKQSQPVALILFIAIVNVKELKV
jgi:rhamnogalacturonyl hydrolase YesR